MDSEWREWSNHVLLELKRLDKELQHIDKSISKVHIELATLKVKAGIWGSIGAVTSILLLAIGNYLFK